jgi:hypothetical protein
VSDRAAYLRLSAEDELAMDAWRRAFAKEVGAEIIRCSRGRSTYEEAAPIVRQCIDRVMDDFYGVRRGDGGGRLGALIDERTSAAYGDAGRSLRQNVLKYVRRFRSLIR